MALATQVPIEEYLATSYHPDCDFIDGYIEERTSGEVPHSSLQVIVATYVHSRRRLWGVRAYTEQRVRVTPQRVRIPDICLVPTGNPLPRVLVHPPLACVEILSGCDTLRSMEARMNDYQSLGVQHLWILDPEALEAWIWAPHDLKQATTLMIPGTPISLPTTELFNELNDTDV